MSTFLLFNIIISVIIVVVFILGYFSATNLVSDIASLLGAVQFVIFLCFLGFFDAGGGSKTTALPADEFEIVKTKDKVILMVEPPVIFDDARTFVQEKYETIEKIERSNAYGFVIATEYKLK